MNVVERAVRVVDRFQTRRPVTAVPVAIVRKFADDRGTTFAALLTYYGFLSLFPLLILGLTVLGQVLTDNPSFRETVLDSVVGQFPVIGGVLENNVQALQASGFALVLGALGLLWGATGLYNSGQLAMSQLWNVEGIDRPGFAKRLLRSVLLFCTLGGGVLAGALLVHVGVLQGVDPLLGVTTMVGSTLLSAAIFLAAFRILTPPAVRLRHMWAGALVAGVAWQGVQILGTWLISTRLAQTGDLYGVFAYVLGALSWIYLGSQIALFATEVNVVVVRELWPRRIAQPPLLDADKEVLTAIVHNERRRPEQHIDVTYDDSVDVRPGDEGGGDGDEEADAEAGSDAGSGARSGR